jgi:hypothetical protein
VLLHPPKVGPRLGSTTLPAAAAAATTVAIASSSTTLLLLLGDSAPAAAGRSGTGTRGLLLLLLLKVPLTYMVQPVLRITPRNTQQGTAHGFHDTHSASQ